MRHAIVILLISVSASALSQSYTDAQAKALSESYAYESIKEYEKAIAVLHGGNQSTEDYFLNLRLGWLNYLKGDFTAALRHYQSAQSAQPSSIEANVGILNVLYYSKEYRKLASAATDVLKLDGANYYARLYLVLVDMVNKNYSSAEIRVNDALKFYPIDLKLNANLAYVYSSQGRKDDARSVLGRLQTIYGKENTEVIALEKALK